MSLTTAQRRALMRQHITDVVLALVTLSHPAWDAPIRAVNNTENITHDGEEYIAYPFKVQLPNLDEDRQRARLTIQNVDRRIGYYARLVDSPIEVEIRVVLGDDPAQLLVKVENLVLRGVAISTKTVEGELTTDGLAFEPAGVIAFVGKYFPAMFASA